MDIYHSIIIILWIFFGGYWLASARNQKKNIRRTKMNFWIYALILFLILFFFDSYASRNIFPQTNYLEISGVLLCAIGVAIAIWARKVLGRNWSSHVAIKQNHTLIQSGPYKLIRHPIYSGMFLALLGTLLVVNMTVWSIVILFVFFELFMKMLAEEKILIGEFGKKYLDYKKKTKRIIPYVL